MPLLLTPKSLKLHCVTMADNVVQSFPDQQYSSLRVLMMQFSVQTGKKNEVIHNFMLLNACSSLFCYTIKGRFLKRMARINLVVETEIPQVNLSSFECCTMPYWLIITSRVDC